MLTAGFTQCWSAGLKGTKGQVLKTSQDIYPSWFLNFSGDVKFGL